MPTMVAWVYVEWIWLQMTENPTKQWFKQTDTELFHKVIIVLIANTYGATECQALI